MHPPKLPLIAVAALSLLAACAKQETTTTASAATTPAPAVTSESTTPSTPADTMPADATAVEDTTAAQATMETAIAAPTEPAKAPTPAPMLPRRGESAPVPQPQSTDERHAAAQSSQRITIADAYEIMRAGNGVLVDVRNADAHQYQRIPGSLSIPLDQIANRASELPQDKWIITYCTCPAEESSGAAAATLTNMGFERVAALLGGMQGWRGAGLPVEFGQ